jgi:hypothetical protein
MAKEQIMEYDTFKHSPLRYLGYANELGKEFDQPDSESKFSRATVLGI